MIFFLKKVEKIFGYLIFIIYICFALKGDRDYYARLQYNMSPQKAIAPVEK
jgi:hypothetical protein